MSEKTLIAGPWVGEFGWELFAWQAYIRALSRNFDKTVIICRETSTALYADFANEFIHTNPKTGLADSYFMYGLNTQALLQEILMKNRHLLMPRTTIFGPRKIGFPPYTHYTASVRFGDHMVKPEYIKYAHESDFSFDYIFHIRNRNLRKGDNWSIENWQKLLDLLSSDGSKVACVGIKEESGWIEGTEDLRGLKSNNLLGTLSNAKCVFGPSSGPMHLASLCGCPHVVWSINQNFSRYTENWNPLETPVLFLSKFDWHPSADFVYNEFMKWRQQ